jgi:hypothetical protein
MASQQTVHGHVKKKMPPINQIRDIFDEEYTFGKMNSGGHLSTLVDRNHVSLPSMDKKDNSKLS